MLSLKHALDIGLNGDGFDDCLDSGSYAQEVPREFDEGLATGVTGTPLSVDCRKLAGA